MSRLKLYWPQECLREDRIIRDDTEPIVFSFMAYKRRLENDPSRSVLMRAKLIHRNRRCPSCRHPEVELIELADAIFSRSNLPIPGTATLVGFHCHGCRAEWPA